MGRQINFYMNKNVEEEFIDKIFCDGYSLVVEYLEDEKITIYSNRADLVLDRSRCYIYNQKYGAIVTKWKKYVDNWISPVIEFSRTTLDHEGRKVVRGRLWAQTQYYNSEGVTIHQNPDLLKEFNILVLWIKKRVPFQETIIGNYYKIKQYINDDILQLYNQGYRLL
jgi:hypothetical protein